MGRNVLRGHGATFCSHGCSSGHCTAPWLTRLRKKPTLGGLPLRQTRRMAADLHDGGGWDRLALVGGEQACHTPCPCHASQPHSSHTDANQGRLPWKEVPEKCRQTSVKEAACRVSHIGHKNLLHSRLVMTWKSVSKCALV